jgi:hypothetical protein
MTDIHNRDEVIFKSIFWGQPTLLQQCRTVKTLVASLHHFTRFIAPFNSFAASQYHFTTVQDSENPCCQPTPFYTVYCPIIYLDLSIRLKKVNGFLSFSH